LPGETLAVFHGHAVIEQHDAWLTQLVLLLPVEDEPVLPGVA